MAYFEAMLLVETDECILWPYTVSAGYGQVWVDGIYIGVHVLACTRTFGACPPDKQEVAHWCRRQKACFNPRHLRWATYVENMADRKRCIWCGKQCEDQEALDEHEDECAP